VPINKKGFNTSQISRLKTLS